MLLTRIVLSTLLWVPVVVSLDHIVCPQSISTVTNVSLNGNGPSYHEISGLALSPTQKAPSGEPVMFGVNDRGGGKRLGVFDSGTGQHLMTLSLDRFQMPVKDFEALAIGSCGSTGEQETCIYIGDTGDNQAREGGTSSMRNGTPYQIFKIIEPDITSFVDGDEIPVTSFSVLPINYALGPTAYADSEALFLDHTGWGDGEVGDLYLLTKFDPELSRLFRIPASSWPTYMNGQSLAPIFSPEAVSNGPGHLDRLWTGADMTLDGTVIALEDVMKTHLFLRCPGMSVAEALDQEVCYTWKNPRGENLEQFETFAWAPDGNKALRMSECAEGCNPALGWSVMEYGSTGKSCPEVEWSQLTDGGWYCRSIDDDAVVPNSWCEDRNLVIPKIDTTEAPSNAPSNAFSEAPSSAPSNARSEVASYAPSNAPSQSPTFLRSTIAPTNDHSSSTSSPADTLATSNPRLDASGSPNLPLGSTGKLLLLAAFVILA